MSLRSNISPSEMDKYFMNLAIKEAKKAFKKKEVPVGAIVVLDNEIIARAYNRVELLFDPIAHAEIIAIKKATKRIKNWRLTRATLYVTKEPCIMCAGAMVNSRLSRLVYGCRDEKRGAAQSIYQILSDNRLNHQVQILSGVQEEACAQLLKEFFQTLR